MAKEQNKNRVSDLPKCIKDLLIETPSAITKLCALWDGLTAETQVKILSEIKTGSYSVYFTNRIYPKAVKSKNSYVRYLAAKDLYFGEHSSDEINALEQLVKDDPNPLVKYSLHEDANELSSIFDKLLKEPKSFFKLPQEARLAKVRVLTGGGEEIAAIIGYAIDNLLENKKVSEQELADILLDYLNKPEFRPHYEKDSYSYDGYGEYLRGKDLGALWGLVSKVPKSCSYVLIKYLPASGGLSHDIPKNIIDKLDDWQLEHLLDRDDIGFADLRKKIFWEYVDSNQEKAEEDEDESWGKSMLLGAAISHNFQLSYDDFAKILSKPEKQKIEILNELTNANDLELCIYEAIHDVMFNSNVDMFSWEHAEFAKYPFERKLKKIKDYQLKKELLGLRLYRLANQVMPWKGKRYELTEKLEFLKEYVVEGDTWKTFMAFSNAWQNQRVFSKNNLEKYLPIMDEIEEESESLEDENTISNDEKTMSILELSSLKAEIGKIKFLIYAVIVLIIILLIIS
ncbi:MAG: hypothetical protein FVQ80_04820 [Planctomycetes bacterium]|nr:hypothetical protein [Planctomycetota bacterium]